MLDNAVTTAQLNYAHLKWSYGIQQLSLSGVTNCGRI